MQIRSDITFVILFLVLSVQQIYGQQSADQWVDSVMNTLTPPERLGQLFMIRAHSDLGPEHIQEVERQIREFKVGSLCFFQGTPQKQAELTNRYQGLSDVPLMVAIDAEWGLGMRFKENGFSYPRQLTLGAVQDNRLIFEMGKDIGRQLKRLGIHVNFAPVVDINNNPLNPVINDRSFGEDRYNVTAKSYMYMRGMQTEGVMACAKHFPGHGDTDVDSHHDLPQINHDRQRLDSIELYPFEILAARGLGSMMIAHLSVPAIDETPNLPTSLSEITIKQLLRDELAFEGLVFTDALEMKGVTKYYEDGEVEARSLLAGNDILCLPQNIDKSFEVIKKYLDQGLLTQDEIDHKARRVLKAKYEYNLTKKVPIPLEGMDKDLFPKSSIALKTKIYEKATTLLQNKLDLLPLQHTDLMNVASVSIGVGAKTKFQERVSSYIEADHYTVDKEISAEKADELLSTLEENDIVLVSIHDMSKYASRSFGITESTRAFIDRLNAGTKVVLTLFGSPYATKYFEDVDALICGYQDEEIVQDVVAQQLFGAITFQGRLPVTASPAFPFNKGIQTKSLMRLGYSIPERVELNSDSLNNMVHIVDKMIEEHAAPGCQILVAKEGKIVFEKSYGDYDYSGKKKVTPETIYDLASVTKVVATTLAVMKLVQEEKINIKDRLDRYLPELRGTNKGGITVEETMAHHGGFIGWIPFYKETLTGSFRSPRPDPKWYRSIQNSKYSIQVADKMFMHTAYVDSVWSKIILSDLRSTRGYRYSDLGFYLLGKLVREVTGKSLDEYCEDNFYKPMNLRNTYFNPLNHVNSTRIAPSERDGYYRRQTIRGYVHDMGAAMLGGVSGHAGLFSNASDLAVIMQMLLNGGYYGGHQYFKPEIIDQFAKRYIYSTRRGIGFDMKELDHNKTPNVTDKSSILTFGHTGFTGTCVWADPTHNLVFIFLSNRTYPTMTNNRLYKHNYRIRLHAKAYESRLR